MCCRTENMKSLISHLLGDTRTAILAVLLLRPDEPQHVRELARLTGVLPGTLHRELTALESLGVLRRNAVGRQVFFAANRECPVFEELAGLVRKTAGLVDVVRTHCCRTPPPHRRSLYSMARYLWLGCGGHRDCAQRRGRNDPGRASVCRSGEGAGAGAGIAAAGSEPNGDEVSGVPAQAPGERQFCNDSLDSSPAVGDRQRP